MNENIENTVYEYIQRQMLFKPGENVLLAVSGGADSAAMLYILNSLNTAGRIKIKIHTAHINHRLRGSDSDIDEIFVKNTAEKLLLPITTTAVDVRGYAAAGKLSIETAARQLRLDALRKIGRKYNCGVIATAHQKNDNTETIIHRILRGTGYAGLAGIRAEKRFDDDMIFVRPLLGINRKQVEDYLSGHKLTWRVDKTNADCRFRRNFLRHKLIPAIQKDCKEPLEDLLTVLAGKCCRMDEKIAAYTENIWKKCSNSRRGQVVVNRTVFLMQTEPVQVQIVKKAMSRLDCGLRKFTRRHYRRILDFIKNAEKGKSLSLPNDFCLIADLNQISFSKITDQAQTVQSQVEIRPGRRTKFGKWNIETEILCVENCDFEKFKAEKDNLSEWFDMAKIRTPIIARTRKNGDKFIPFGRSRQEKAGKFLTAAKLSRKEKEELFVIADTEKILWLVPVRPSAETAVTAKTVKIVRIKCNRTETG